MKRLLTACSLSTLLISCAKDKPGQPIVLMPVIQVRYEFQPGADSILFTWDRLPNTTYGVHLRNAKMKENSSFGNIMRGGSKDTFAVMGGGIGPDTWYFVKVYGTDSVRRIYTKDTTGFKFRTPCKPFTKFYPDGITTNSFTIEWGNGGDMAYDIKGFTLYVREKGLSGTLQTLVTNEEKYKVEGLKSKTTYEYKLSYVCSEGQAVTSPDWMQITTF